MSLPESGQESLFAAGNEFPDLLPNDDPMVVFAERVFPSFSDREFEEYGIESRFAAEGWSAAVTDGRDHDSLESGLKAANGDRQHVVVAQVENKT